MVHIYFIDIDNFKDINDLYGHGVGDEVLKTIGERLKGLYGRNQSFRVGGDEFLIISESNYQTGIRNINLDENEVAAINSTKIIELITRPIFTNNHEIHIGVSIGVTYSKVEEDFVLSDFIQLADTAMYNAKKSGKGIYKILTPKALSEIKRVLQYEHDFIHAIEFNEITPVYQYTYDLSTNKPVDIEVYGRWYYKGEVLNPDFYLPIAHKYHLIKEHDLFVISKAFEDFKDKINEDLTITVNLSYHSFRRIKPELIKELADKSSINPKYICIDLPQKVFNDSNSINRLKIYDNYGFSLNMNQFNISYNTFEQLLLVSVKYIKLKRDFLEQNENEFKEMLNKNVLSTFKDLDLNIVFEGVENAEDLNYLRQHKIRYAKGYYFDRPDVYEKK
jgi:diguanylate cyclase (GGDEF)-like protein